MALASFVATAWPIGVLLIVTYLCWRGLIWFDPDPVKTRQQLQAEIERGEITIDEIESKIEGNQP